jgi:2-phospho-L-lactate guanylyltransferase
MTLAPQLWAVLPVKSLACAKRRLAPLLDGDERRRLARAMLEDVLEACAGAASLAGILVVTADDEAAAIAKEAGARVLPEADERGTNDAVQAGLRSTP